MARPCWATNVARIRHQTCSTCNPASLVVWHWGFQFRNRCLYIEAGVCSSLGCLWTTTTHPPKTPPKDHPKHNHQHLQNTTHQHRQNTTYQHRRTTQNTTRDTTQNTIQTPPKAPAPPKYTPKHHHNNPTKTRPKRCLRLKQQIRTQTDTDIPRRFKVLRLTDKQQKYVNHAGWLGCATLE